MFELGQLRTAVDGSFRLSSGKLLPTTPVFDMFWRFAYERQEMFLRRAEGGSFPWTQDPILRTFRFTNPYRASDRVSQYLIRHVIYHGDQSWKEVFFRTILFKFFNRIETWELLSGNVGTISWKSFEIDRLDAVLTEAMKAGRKVYSPAFIIPPPRLGAQSKHTNHLRLLAKMFKDNLPEQVAEAKSLRAVYLALRKMPSLGEFLAFQNSIDLNYSTALKFSEMDFVVAGPGAKSGIRRAFRDLGGLSEEEVIREVAEAADREFAIRGLMFRTLWGRPLQLVDCQNLFCEIDKYSRAALPAAIEGHGRSRIKQKYRPNLAVQIPQWYPPKWQLRMPEHLLAESLHAHQASLL